MSAIIYFVDHIVIKKKLASQMFVIFKFNFHNMLQP